MGKLFDKYDVLLMAGAGVIVCAGYFGLMAHQDYLKKQQYVHSEEKTTPSPVRSSSLDGKVAESADGQNKYNFEYELEFPEALNPGQARPSPSKKDNSPYEIPLSGMDDLEDEIEGILGEDFR